ncbi:MAG: hypothetical protein K940chlam7_00893 [Chlamydiae bacterium]|nr:hypothetical protein [Chlamydiota bacterium]
MLNALGNILLIVSCVGLACYIGYKVIVYLIDKMSSLIERSRVFRIMLFAIMSILFFVGGLNQLFDYYAGKQLELTRYFPLSFGVSGVLIYLTVLAYYKDPKQPEPKE